MPLRTSKRNREAKTKQTNEIKVTKPNLLRYTVLYCTVLISDAETDEWYCLLWVEGRTNGGPLCGLLTDLCASRGDCPVINSDSVMSEVEVAFIFRGIKYTVSLTASIQQCRTARGQQQITAVAANCIVFSVLKQTFMILRSLQH
jgi:hypothetical protein